MSSFKLSQIASNLDVFELACSINSLNNSLLICLSYYNQWYYYSSHSTIVILTNERAITVGFVVVPFNPYSMGCLIMKPIGYLNFVTVYTMYIANYIKMLSLVEKCLSMTHTRLLKTQFPIGKDISDRICHCKSWSQKAQSLMILATEKCSYHKLETEHIHLILVAYFATVLTVAYAVTKFLQPAFRSQTLSLSGHYQ